MTPMTSSQKMAARRVKLLAQMKRLGFLHKGQPSYSALETALIEGYDRGVNVSVTIGTDVYWYDPNKYDAQLPAPQPDAAQGDGSETE